MSHLSCTRNSILHITDQKFPVVTIPGCRSAERVEENAKAATLNLSSEDLIFINDLVKAADVRGLRYPQAVLDACQIDRLPLDAWSGEGESKEENRL